MDFQKMVRSIRSRPAVYGLDGSLASLEAFILGWDLGSQGSMLLGFREWLVLRFDGGNNLSWQALIRRMHKMEVEREGRIEPDLSADGLFDVLDRFFDDRNQSDGILRIYAMYADWLRSQEWFRPEMLN
ncbi:hypothetical protein [Kribbella sp. NPDC055071]